MNENEIVRVTVKDVSLLQNADLSCSCGWKTSAEGFDRGGYLGAGHREGTKHLRDEHGYREIVSKQISRFGKFDILYLHSTLYEKDLARQQWMK